VQVGDRVETYSSASGVAHQMALDFFVDFFKLVTVALFDKHIEQMPVDMMSAVIFRITAPLILSFVILISIIAGLSSYLNDLLMNTTFVDATSG
jgi:hypothetical protein